MANIVIIPEKIWDERYRALEGCFGTNKWEYIDRWDIVVALLNSAYDDGTTRYFIISRYIAHGGNRER